MNSLPAPYARPVALPERSSLQPQSNVLLGTAAWLNFGEAERPSFRTGDLWLSRLPSGEPVGLRDDRHVLVASGTRAGKGVSVIIPNLCLWAGSAVVIDPKGENAMVTARRRGNGSAFCEGMGQKVRILDPFHTVGTTRDHFADLKAAYNPFDMLGVENEEAIDNAARIADSIIVSENSADPFWDEAARGLLKSLMLHVASWRDYQPHERNLITVRRVLLAGDAEARKLLLMAGKAKVPSGLALLFAAMRRNHAFGGVVANAGEMFGELEKGSSKTFDGILQVACTNTDFLESTAMQRVLGKSDFSLGELKSDARGTTLYLCLPQRYMQTHFRWLRMMATLVTTEMERMKFQPASGHPVLMVLDEFAVLRRMRSIENAAAQIAGYGVKMMFVVQTLAQLKDTYRDNWETFLANAGVKIFFGNDDHFTREYVSRLIGDCEIVRTTRNSGLSGSESSGSSASHSIGVSSRGYSLSQTYGSSQNQSSSYSSGITEGVHKRALVTPDEVGRLFGDRNRPAALVLISGHQPLMLTRTSYFNDPMFGGLFDWHADHSLPLTRAQSNRRRLEEQRCKEEERRVAERRQGYEKSLRKQEQEEADRRFYVSDEVYLKRMELAERAKQSYRKRQEEEYRRYHSFRGRLQRKWFALVERIERRL